MPITKRFKTRCNELSTDLDVNQKLIENKNKPEEIKLDISCAEDEAPEKDEKVEIKKDKEVVHHLFCTERERIDKKRKNFLWSDSVVVFASLIWVSQFTYQKYRCQIVLRT